LAEIHQLKNQLIRLRRSVWPQREMTMSLTTTESPFIERETREYFRDVLDHCSQLADVLEMYRDSATGLQLTRVEHRVVVLGQAQATVHGNQVPDHNGFKVARMVKLE
jgi:hypothetical protein